MTKLTKEYIDSLEKSLLTFLAEEQLKDEPDEGRLHTIQYVFNKIEIGPLYITKEDKLPKTKPLNEIVQERLDNSIEEPLTEAEETILLFDAELAIQYADNNIRKERYNDAIPCAERAINDAEILSKWAPESKLARESIQGLAKRLISDANTCLNDPINGKKKLEMQKYARLGQYEKAAEIQKELGLSKQKYTK